MFLEGNASCWWERVNVLQLLKYFKNNSTFFPPVKRDICIVDEFIENIRGLMGGLCTCFCSRLILKFLYLFARRMTP